MGVPLATLVPTAPDFTTAAAAVSAAHRYVLSRFAYLHREGDAALLESPLATARVVLHDWRAGAMVQLLAAPRRCDDLRAGVPDLDQAAVGDFLALLITARMAGAARADGGCAADEAPALRTWEFHDLLFHARTRSPRGDRPFGGTYRFLGELEPPAPLPALPAAGAPLELYRPHLHQLEETDPPLARVQEARRSIREYGAQALTGEQLGEFLYRVGRVADYSEDELQGAAGAVRLAAAARPYAAAGGLYELELHVLVRRCDGLPGGLYRYDAERHCLWARTAPLADLEALAGDAGLAAAIPQQEIQVLVVVAARVARIAWKYASIAYALVLKDVGVLYDTMYLAATAMGLAPCALGAGSADLFARAAGLDAHDEVSVGEFLLGSRAAEPGG